MKHSADKHMRLKKYQGLTGNCWGARAPLVADLTLPQVAGGPIWGLTEYQMELTQNLKAIIGHPIRDPKDNNQIVGILSFDSVEPVAKFLSSHKSLKLMADLAYKNSLLLDSYNLIQSPLD